MQLFENFEAVKFPEENLILVTHYGYLYYIYNLKHKYWKKYRNAGKDSITVKNYEDVSKEEITTATDGKFPEKETDFSRLCYPKELWLKDMIDLLEEDYPSYMDDGRIHSAVYSFLYASTIRHVSYSKVRKLFDKALKAGQDNTRVLNRIKELSFAIIGKDIYKREIDIVDGYDGSSHFWIKPVRVIDYKNTTYIDSVAEMKGLRISIEEDDVFMYLSPYLNKHFDNELKANKKRFEYGFTDEDDDPYASIDGFEWNLTHNFYTFDAVTDILDDINDTVDALLNKRETEYTAELMEKIRRNATLHPEDFNEQAEIDLAVDFYRRFCYRMEYMIRVGKEDGFNLISFMGP